MWRNGQKFGIARATWIAWESCIQAGLQNQEMQKPSSGCQRHGRREAGCRSRHKAHRTDVPVNALRVRGRKSLPSHGAGFFLDTREVPQRATEEIIGELQALFARHNAGAALSAKAVLKLTKEFHTARHTLYSAEENMEIDKVVPVAASVKTKLGVGPHSSAARSMP